MAADAWVVHNDIKRLIGDGTINLDSDSFEMRLATSASNVASVSVSDATSVTNEVSGNGYAADTLAATWDQVTATTTFNADSGVFTASGGSITSRFAYIVDTTTTPDRVICHSLIDNTPADVTVTDGNALTIGVSAGIFAAS